MPHCRKYATFFELFLENTGIRESINSNGFQLTIDY
jgi:hypothetical protein